MVFINEWLPNPPGSDAKAEWIELVNEGDEPVTLGGWRIERADGKRFIFGDRQIGAGAFLVITKKEFRFALRNNDEELRLFDRSNTLVQEIAFIGTAPDGKSLNRTASGDIFLEPTPGALNGKGGGFQTLAAAYAAAQPAPTPGSPGGAFVPLIGSAIFMAAVALFIAKHHEVIHKLFFSGDQKIR